LSKTGTCQKGAGYYLRHFNGSIAVSTPDSNYKLEIAKLKEAVCELCSNFKQQQAIFFIDPQIAIHAVGTNSPIECQLILACRDELP
jgi:hypothetical protein